jgi:hypothetical protein
MELIVSGSLSSGIKSSSPHLLSIALYLAGKLHDVYRRLSANRVTKFAVGKTLRTS